MISKNNALRKNLLCKFGVIFVSILLFDKVRGSAYEDIDIVEYFEQLQNDHLSENKNIHRYQHAHETNHGSDNYPYEKIRKIVKQTKEILMTSGEYRNILKFDPKYDEDYMFKYNKRYFYNDENDVGPVIRYNVDHQSSPNTLYHQGQSKSGKQKNANSKTCGFSVHTYKPQRLSNENGKQYWILNLEGEFVQEVTATHCLKQVIGIECGSNILVPELYKNVCEQSYGVHKLFAIPEGEEIDMSTQDIVSFKLPNGCHCKSSDA